MAENLDTSTKDENFILTCHEKSKRVTCVCGKLIEGDHTCLITKSDQTRVIFQDCGYKSWRRENKGECEVCIKEENFQKYLDSSYTGQDGYEYCSFCHKHVHCCSCVAFVDRDGKKKCKKCKELWTGPDVDSGVCESEVCVKECESCGFNGDT